MWGQGRSDAAVRWWPRLLAAAVATALVVALLPPVRAGAGAAGVLGEALDLGVRRPLAAEVTRERTTVGGVPGDLYAPQPEAPAVLFVPGATPAGLDDRRTVRVAEAYARAGRAVFVPDLELYRQRFSEADLDALVDAALALAGRAGTRGRVVIAGFSYGGSFALVAAADPRLDGLVAHVGVFGAYHDLVGVVQAATTGVSLVGGQRIPWQADPAAAGILRDAALELVPPGQRDALGAALDGVLDAADLPPGAASVHALFVNTDPERTYPLARRLPTDARSRLARFSPATVADRLDVPVTVLHSRHDAAVPYAEALQLARDLPDARLYTVSLFRHVDFRPEREERRRAVAADLWRTWRFAGRLLRAQERRLPAWAARGTPPRWRAAARGFRQP